MKLKSSNLLIITDRYPHNKDPVSSSFVYSQIDALKKYFDTIHVISLNPFIPKLFSRFSFMNPRWRKDAFAKDYSYDNVEVRFARYFMLPFDFVKERKGEFAYRVAKKIIEREKIDFDLIHAHFIWPSGYVGAKLKEKCGKPLIITGRGHDVYDLPFRNEGWKEKIYCALNNADYVITVSNSILECIKKLNVKTPTKVILNGFRTDLFFQRDLEECRKITDLPLDKKIILSVGNLEEVKGHKYFIEAIKEVINQGKDVFCVIVGNGKLKNKLEKQIKKFGLTDYAVLVGEKKHDEIPFWMNASDIFVLPSLAEGNPNVMFECLGCGKPFVGTTVGGIPEIIINEKLGILVEPKDVDGLTKAILKALEKEWDKDYISNYAKQFTRDKVPEKIMEVYDEVLKED
jgi:glycosyltransferase involved in cell wall biosynthesis